MTAVRVCPQGDNPDDPNTLMVCADNWRHGRFRLDAARRDFRNWSEIECPAVVFAREAVRITQAGAEPVLADPNTVMVYNAGRPYRRDALSDRGDRCEWFTLSPRRAVELANSLGLDGEDARKLFPFTHAPCSAELYRIQRKAANLLADPATDPVCLDEAVYQLFAAAIAPGLSARQRRSAAARSPTRGAHRDLAEAARAILAVRFCERVTLDELADDLEVSPYHLARTFRRWTGRPVHRYLTQLRLAAALEMLEDGLPPGSVAPRLGYSSHSHFTQVFTNEVGQPPSQWQRAARGVASDSPRRHD